MDDSDEKIKHLNKILRSIRDINQLIVHEKDKTSLIEKTCEILAHYQGYLNAWIFLFPDSQGPYLFAKRGNGINFDEMEEFLKNGNLPKCAKKALKTGKVILTKDPLLECNDCFLLKKYCGRSAMTAPISYNKNNYGIITVSAPAIFESIEEEMDLFTEMAGDLGYAISSIKTERERASAFALMEENEKKYQKLFDSANDMIYLHETKDDGLPGRILDVNEQACRKMGYTREEFLKKSVQDLNDPDFEGDPDQITGILKNKHNVVLEWGHITKNGDKIPVEISIHNFFMDGENVALSVVRDISERKNLEKELILTLNATTDGIWKLNFVTGEIEFGPGCYKMLGYVPLEFPSNFESWTSFIHPDDRELAAVKIKEWNKNQTIDNFESELRLKAKDGQYRCINISARIVERNKDGSFARAIGTQKDITEKKEQDEALRLTRFSVDKSPVSIFWIKPDGTFFYVNKAACTELGYTKDELLNLKIEDIDPDYPFNKRKDIWSRIKTEKTVHMQNRHMAKNGRTFPVEITTYYLNYGGEEFEISNSTDITERKKSESAILERETKYRELFNNVSEAVFLHKVIKNNKRGNFVEVNDTACRRLGYTRDELLEMTVSDINTSVTREDDIKRIKTLKKTGSINFEGEHVRKDGSVFPVFVKARMIDISGEKFIMSLVRDISKEKETKKTETELLRQIEDNLIQMAALNDKIRNPLAVIMGYVSLEEGDNMDILLRQVKEIDGIINELDRGWLESQKIRDFLKKHYNFEIED